MLSVCACTRAGCERVNLSQDVRPRIIISPEVQEEIWFAYLKGFKSVSLQCDLIKSKGFGESFMTISVISFLNFQALLKLVWININFSILLWRYKALEA
jgi:hypothetical protein